MTDSSPADRTATTKILNRLLSTGALLRMPRNPRQQAILLAVVSQDLERRYPYTEVELGERLRETLERLNAEVDHVTLRRYLVDLGFVRRDRAGNRYLLNFPKLEETLDEATRDAASELVAAALRQAALKKRDKQRRDASFSSRSTHD